MGEPLLHAGKEPDMTKINVEHLNPTDAWNMLEQDKDAVLVDVRTSGEWDVIGVPALDSINKKVVFLSWRLAPSMQVNAEFVGSLKHQVESKQKPLFFICKSGGRSYEAACAMSAQGYTQCYNIIGGFEGKVDSNSSEIVEQGWKTLQLPWEQK